MAAKGSRHTTATNLLAKTLENAFGRKFTVRRQDPLALEGDVPGEDSMPEPDIAVVSGSDEDYRPGHPTTAVLVVEVSDTTLAIDQGRKARIHARAGIPDYWIVNLQKNVLEVRRRPVQVRNVWGYDDVKSVSPRSLVTPLAAPKKRIAIANLF